MFFLWKNKGKLKVSIPRELHKLQKLCGATKLTIYGSGCLRMEQVKFVVESL